MRDFLLRTDLTRAVIDGFALPLGIAPDGLRAPAQGYTITYNPSEEDEPDTYAFHVVVSHEKLDPLVRFLFERFLPDEIHAIVEIGSRDAYRSLDTYMSQEPIGKDSFIDVWRDFCDILLEDVTIGVGANSEEPFVEVFLDHWKGVSIHVPPESRDDVEHMLQDEFDLHEVPQTWPPDDGPDDLPPTRFRQVLDLSNEFAPDIDELLLVLRREWALELNIDPETNVDEKGRRLGLTLWHAVLIVEPRNGQGEPAYASVWATAGSLVEMEELIDEALHSLPQWRMAEVFTVDRIAYDERPDALGDLPPRRLRPEVHRVQIDAPATDVSGQDGADGSSEGRITNG
jgi:hypothetical protein